jgi:glutamate formiminotransferase/formiminotetrahydrofolate cyclodeaminase
MHKAWLDALAAESPTPGAGSTAAVVAAAAASLAAKAARRSVGEWAEAEGAAAQALALRERAARLAEENDVAYRRATALLERGGEAGPGRDFSLGLAIAESARIPGRIAATAADVALLAAAIAEHAAAGPRGDALAAADLAAGAAAAARTLVAVNLTMAPNDARIAAADASSARAQQAVERAR